MTIGQGISYSAPVNFNIPQNAPDLTDVPQNMQGIISDIYTNFQQIIQGLVNQCGIGQQLPSNWASLAATPGSTILASNMGRLYAVASEAIPQGALVNFWLNGSVLNARNANATNNTKPAQGYCSTGGGLAANAPGEFIVNGGTIAITGLVVGARYYLSTTNGLVSATPATASGNIEQYVGFAAQTNLLVFNCGYFVQH